MKTRIISFPILFLLMVNLACQGQNNKLRQPAVSGSFYPANKASLESQLSIYFSEVDNKTFDTNLAAIIVPHAGYIFSGQVAASAYAMIDPDKDFNRIFIIGTSHHVMLNGASVYNQGDYLTPLGRVSVDSDLANRLIKENRLFSYDPNAHNKEHSIEVQLPFLQYHLNKPFEIVPIVIGAQTAETCRKLAESLKPYFTPENLFVISSDFSHYPDYANAVKNDQATGLAIQSNSPSKFINVLLTNEKNNVKGLVTSCCGWSSVLTLLDITSMEPGMDVKHIRYMNSGDTPYGDKNRVVGYHSFIFTRSSSNETGEEFSLSHNDKAALLKIARESIETGFQKKPAPVINENELSDVLKKNCGAFVTLHKNGQLRGCIGRFLPDESLYIVVQEMARAAAFDDFRFEPVIKKEMNSIEIEISVLTPLKRIYSIDEFRLGEQGIYIVKGNHSGTFLPQVAETTHWNKEEFLGHCARDKAGIGWDGWKDADLYTYEAVIFDETELTIGK